MAGDWGGFRLIQPSDVNSSAAAGESQGPKLARVAIAECQSARQVEPMATRTGNAVLPLHGKSAIDSRKSS
jgi:hypothetical protein